jgi:hypothetical protein
VLEVVKESEAPEPTAQRTAARTFVLTDPPEVLFVTMVEPVGRIVMAELVSPPAPCTQISVAGTVMLCAAVPARETPAVAMPVSRPLRTNTAAALAVIDPERVTRIETVPELATSA